MARAGAACDFGRLSPQRKAAFPSQLCKASSPSQVPEDKYLAQRALSESRMGRRATGATGDLHGDIFESPRSDAELARPDTNMSMGSTTGGGPRRDMREKFLKYANKVGSRAVLSTNSLSYTSCIVRVPYRENRHSVGEYAATSK